MREIKFRALNDKNEFIYGFYMWNFNPYLKENEICDSFIYRGLRNIESAIPVNGLTVGQYTGLKDKNGVEIYDGDICKRERHAELYEIIWHKESWQIKNETENAIWYQAFNGGASSKELTIIGNVYQHPKLLNPKEI